ncbi:MAG TPA: hypothetical protein VHY32_08950 [Caulobacteraceae bacterium]|jgi:hypothetical protein|nr:hypothetical protein [Caulobacteraceae bacterium]
MKTKILLGAVAAAFIASQAQAGCVGGAVVGGVAGHFAHHHALLGAAAGCVVGHELAVHKKRQREAERRARWEREHHPG